MYENDNDIEAALKSAAFSADASPDRRQAVHSQLLNFTAAGGRRRAGLPKALIAAVLLVSVAAVGLAATETGREFVRSLFTRIEPVHVVSGEHGPGSTWSVSRSGPGSEPFSEEETKSISTMMDETAALRKAGEGRLLGIIDAPGVPSVPGGEKILTVCLIEYTLASGEKQVVGTQPNQAQITRMRYDEVMSQYDAGKGEVLSRVDGPMGFGHYSLRFTLDDGQTVDLRTIFPPSTRAEREAIFAEAKELKEALRFAVDSPASRTPDGRVTAILRYTLADGRVVGITEDVPAEAISADGKYVITSLNEVTTEIRDQGGQ